MRLLFTATPPACGSDLPARAGQRAMRLPCKASMPPVLPACGGEEAHPQQPVHRNMGSGRSAATTMAQCASSSVAAAATAAAAARSPLCGAGRRQRLVRLVLQLVHVIAKRQGAPALQAWKGRHGGKEL